LGEVLALLSALFFSSSNLMARQGMKRMDRSSGQLVTLLVTNAMNIVAIIFMMSLSLMPQLNLMGLLYFGLAGIFTTFAGRFFLFASIERIGATRAGLFKVSAPMFTILLGVYVLGDQLSIRDLLGSAVVLSGMYILSASRDMGKPVAPPIGIVPMVQQDQKLFSLDKGVVFGVLSGLSLSVGHVFRKLGVMYIASPIIGVAAGTLVSLLCFMIYVLLQTRDPGKLSGPALEAVRFKESSRGFIWGGFFNTFAQYLFFLSLIYANVSIANILISTEALFNLLLVAMFFRSDEPVTPRLIYLSLFILAGVVLIIL
jgi:drug/metabolite transporter, DME family